VTPVYTLASMGVRAVISANSVQVEPGASAAVTVTIRNTGAVVDHFHVDVLGDAVAWATVTPTTLPLFPDAQGLVTIDFHPPRASNVPAGSVPFGVRVASEVNPGDATVEEGTLEVGAFTGMHAEMVPEISRGRGVGRHQIAFDNLGNAPLVLGFRATDPENTLRFDFRPRNPVGQPGTATIVRLGVRPRHRILLGSPRTYRFQLVVQPKDGQPATINGSLVQMPVVPKALVGLVGLIAAGGVAALVWLGPLHSGSQPLPASTPTSAPSATPAATPTPSPSATPSPSPSPSPTPEPTDTPTANPILHTFFPIPTFEI
jgi:hypothetical protein